MAKEVESLEQWDKIILLKMYVFSDTFSPRFFLSRASPTCTSDLAPDWVQLPWE